MFQKIINGYIFYFLGQLFGGQLFELFARETNLKKQSSVHMISNIPNPEFPKFLDQSELIGLIRIQNWKFVKLCGEYLAHIHLEIIFQR